MGLVGLQRLVDLRSDTVTLPTEEMFEAIKEAELGDDVYGEDPTVNRLEEIAAEKMGKESALLVTSGTQGNLVSLLAHTKMGDEVILEEESHIYNFEVGGLSAIGGLIPKPLKGTLGALDPGDVRGALRHRDIHVPETTLICLENTHSRSGGTIITLGQIRAVGDVAREHGIKVHMDGARIFNAAVALDIDVKELVEDVDSVMFCLSKGLCAPIGSIVAGDEAFIERARKMRKMLGSGMRQAGVIAAPGIIALEKMADRLREDHENARLLAQGLSRVKGISIDLMTVQTNIVNVEIGELGMGTDCFLKTLEEYGVKALTIDEDIIRMVTHRDIGREDVEYTCRVVEEIVSKQDL